mmetsp:Transcript_110913/g.166088  ORF Transcript_110913/g.166088 Transcript_110913/m.166088 type:complete len:575 (-) Transcript_110913:167-1891(-)
MTKISSTTLTLGVLFCVLASLTHASLPTAGGAPGLKMSKMASAPKRRTEAMQLRGGKTYSPEQSEHSEHESSSSSSSRAQQLFQALWETKEKHGDGLSASALEDILTTLREYPELMYMKQKADVKAIEEYNTNKDKAHRVAVFSHSLERNGANIFVLILLQHMTSLDRQAFELYTPAEGPMREDFEKLGVKVNIMKPSDPGYMVSLEEELSNFGAVFANTIMSAPVVRTAQKLGMPYTWVIHEAWPREQFDWYASKVFMQEGIDASIIKEAMAAAEPDTGKIIFPAHVQKGLYAGLMKDEVTNVVYNGIPTETMDEFVYEQNRTAIRESLGYTEDDYVVLHLGTVCARKCQHVTAEAFSKLVNEKGADNAKLLMVGARYIRQHEIEYIEKVKNTLKEGGVEDRAQILDIQSEVLKYYMAADVVLVPSKNEVLPLVIAEAQAFQCPLVVTNIDGLPEAVTDGQEGFLVPPEDAQALADAIDKFHKDSDLAVRTGALGRVRALHQFSHKTMRERYEEIIDEMAPPADKMLQRLVEEPVVEEQSAVAPELQAAMLQKREAMGLSTASQVPMALRAAH